MNSGLPATRIRDARPTGRKNEMTDSPEIPPPESDPIPPMPTGVDERHATVLAAMDRIQNRRPGWTRAIILFVVSLMLFVGSAGAFIDSVRFLSVLVAILFVHELGHYLAMRWFGYRNLRMFFIPFFGAAVSGQNYNVAGWKKVVVSLLGPLPGIGIGILLGVIAVSLKQNPDAEDLSQLLLEIGTVSVVINGFNLLPILPLDGGWVMHALIFCRHPVFDAGFRLLAALSLLVLGAMMNAWFFIFIGLFLMLGIPVTFRMARLAQRLRREGVPSLAADGQIPSETATKIIDGVDDATGHAASAQIAATHSLQVFETINATPPGLIVSVLFVILHLASLGASIGAGFVLMIEKQSSFKDFYNLAMSGPKYTAVCEKPEKWSPPGWVPSEADESLLLVAHRDSLELASKEFKKLSANPPAAGRLMRFGQSLLVDVKNVTAHDLWKNELKAGGGVLPQGPVSIRIHCSLPSVKWASDLRQDCEDYDNWFAGSDWLVPPWSQPENLTDAGLERMRQARRAIQKVRRQEVELGLDAMLDEATVDVEAALEKFSQQQIDGLRNQSSEQRLENLREAVVKVRATVSSPVENQVLDLMLQHELSRPADFKEPKPPEELGELRGQFTPDTRKSIPHRDSASKCFQVRAQQEVFLVAIEVDEFESTSVGLTRLADWLCRYKTTMIQYEITTKSQD